MKRYERTIALLVILGGTWIGFTAEAFASDTNIQENAEVRYPGGRSGTYSVLIGDNPNPLTIKADNEADILKMQTLLTADLENRRVSSLASVSDRMHIVPAADMKPEEVDKLEQDINIMCHLLHKQLKPTYLGGSGQMYEDLFDVSTYFGLQTRDTQGIYIEGYGVLFLMTVNFPLVLPPEEKVKPTQAQQDIQSVWEQAKEEMNQMQTPRRAIKPEQYDLYKSQYLQLKLIEVLKYATNMNRLRPEDWIIIKVTGSYPPKGLARAMTIRASKTDIDAYSQGTLNFEQFHQKVGVLTHLTGKPAWDPQKMLYSLLGSQYRNTQHRPWGPEQLIGEPDSRGAGDSRKAWASRTADEQKEWILLKYEKPIRPLHIEIYENYNPGAVYKVSVYNETGAEIEGWTGQDPTPIDSKRGISRIPLKLDFKTQQVKIYLDSVRVPGWNEIDAVGLIDETGNTHWAVAAEASSTYAQ